MVATAMKLGLKFPERLAGVLYPVREALEDLIVGIEKGWSQEHLGTGQHNAITAVSIGHPTPAETSVLAITSGLEVRQGPASLSRSFAANSADPAVLTPPQITANVDDYSPTGLDQALVIRLSADANRTINGLRRPQPSQARMYWLMNVTSVVITLPQEATSSVASNRFYCPGLTNYFLHGQGAVAILYDPVLLRWRILDSSGAGLYFDNVNTRHGVGTTNPLQLFSVAGTAAVQAGNAVGFYDSANADFAYIKNFGSSQATMRLGFFTSLEALSISRAGFVGVGIAPTFPFQVDNSNSGDYVTRLANTHGSNPFGLTINYPNAAPNGTGNQFFICTDSTPANRIVGRSNGGLANYQANNVDLSDATVKTIHGPAEAERERFRRLTFLQATYNDEPMATPDVMLTAQDVQAIYPSLVIPFDEQRGLLGLRTHGVAMRAYKVIQELDQALLKAEQRIAVLEGVAGVHAGPPDRIQP